MNLETGNGGDPEEDTIGRCIKSQTIPTKLSSGQGCQSCQNVLPNKKVKNEEKNLNLHAEYFNLIHKRAEIKIGKN